MVGLVRSPVMTTLMQVASRIVLTWGIANAVPVAQNHYFLTSMVRLRTQFAIFSFSLTQHIFKVAAWGVTEVIRYSFYALNTLNGKAPYFLTWLRY
jgi:very-long-chain (3R)-3-hydroxyacyl-CoA dehydratase